MTMGNTQTTNLHLMLYEILYLPVAYWTYMHVPQLSCIYMYIAFVLLLLIFVTSYLHEWPGGLCGCMCVCVCVCVCVGGGGGGCGGVGREGGYVCMNYLIIYMYVQLYGMQ